jgi:hypothetical protein
MRRLLDRMQPGVSVVGRYLEEIEDTANALDAEVFGIKVMSEHYRRIAGVASALKAREYRCLYLERDFAQRVLSFLIADIRGMYNSTAETIERQPIIVDPQTLRDWIAEQSNWVDDDLKMLADDGVVHRVVSYEDFASRRSEFFAEVFEFLELDPRSVPDTRYQKMVLAPRDEIANYDEVVEVLVGFGLSLPE